MQPGPRHAQPPPPSAPAPRTRWENWAIVATAAGLVVVIPLIVWLATRPDPPPVEPVAAAPATQTATARPTTAPPAAGPRRTGPTARAHSSITCRYSSSSMVSA